MTEHTSDQLASDDAPTIFDALADVEEAQRRKADGQAQALHASDVRWRSAAERAIRDLAATGEPFDAETLRRHVEVLAASPNAVGAVFTKAHRDGVIRPHGYRTASRKQAHGRTLRTWIGAAVDRD